jgi:hypothetical protein
MNISDQRKIHYISVKKVISIWSKGGVKSVGILLSDPEAIIERESWVEKVKLLIEEKKYLSVDAEIDLVSEIFNNKENGRKEDRKDESESKSDSEHSTSGGAFDWRHAHSGYDTDNDGGSKDL